MRTPLYFFVFLVSSAFFACTDTAKDEAYKVFNQGVVLNVSASEAQAAGRFADAKTLNKQSEAKFRQTLSLDSGHPVARASLAHSLYMGKEFQEAIVWFSASNKVNGESAANYREMGLSKINLGLVSSGKTDLDRAFLLDTSKEIREITVQDLADIGELAFEYSNGYIKEGKLEKGKEYKEFSIGVLILAYHYDSSRQNMASRISEIADSLGDKKTALKFRIKS
jgi:hypothetical protein